MAEISWWLPPQKLPTQSRRATLGIDETTTSSMLAGGPSASGGRAGEASMLRRVRCTVGQRARTRLLRGLCSTSTRPRCSSSGRHVHGEPAAVALAQAVPAADRVVLRAGPRLDGAVLGRLVLVGAAERHPVAVGREHGGHVVDAAGEVAELGRADLADQRGRVGRFVAVASVLGRARWGRQHPRVLGGAVPAVSVMRCLLVRSCRRRRRSAGAGRPSRRRWRRATSRPSAPRRSQPVWMMSMRVDRRREATKRISTSVASARSRRMCQQVGRAGAAGPTPVISPQSISRAVARCARRCGRRARGSSTTGGRVAGHVWPRGHHVPNRVGPRRRRRARRRRRRRRSTRSGSITAAPSASARVLGEQAEAGGRLAPHLAAGSAAPRRAPSSCSR